MTKYRLENLDCANCAVKLENNLKKINSVNYVSIDFATLTMKIDTSDENLVIDKIKEIEPDIIPIKTNISEINNNNFSNLKKEFFIISISLILIIFHFVFKQLYYISFFLLITAYFLSGYKVILKAIKNIFKGKFFDENFLMFIATAGAFLINAPLEAVSVMIFYNIGEFFQNIALNNSRKSIKSLIDLRPSFANVKKENNIFKTTPENVSIGEIIIVKPGEKIPLDGIIIEGNTKIDTSPITGESVPKSFKKGDSVFSGILNLSDTILIKTTKLFNQSSIYKILELVENAAHKKSKTEKFITYFASFYTPIIVIAAILTAFIPPLILPNALFSTWIYRALILMVISCPCALVISIPLGYFGGIGAFAKNGILIKGANFIDVLNKLDTVIFDKTGTLTKGNFEVTKIKCFNNFSENDIIKTAALIESHSNHPISKSIIKKYNNKIDENEVKNFKNISGMGISGLVNNDNVLIGNYKLFQKENILFEESKEEGTIVYLAINKVYAGYILIEDEIKEKSFETIKALRDLGIKNISMFTGDNENISKKTADKLNINSFHSELLPEDKLNLLENIINKNISKKTAFVGDGINDAPVLARADIGISMGKFGSDAAIESSDMVLLNDCPSNIVTAIKLAKKTKKIVSENIILALGIKLVFFILGVLGFANMWEAIFADVGVALIAILNSTRIIKIKYEKVGI